MFYEFTEIRQLAQQVGQKLIEKKWTITTAESCTAGGISYALTTVSGSSGFLNQAFVTYSNQSKSSLVGVSKQSLVENGAVSEQVVEQMSKGALVE